MTQVKQARWLEQWQTFKDDELFLFMDWIYPNSLDDFRGKSVLEAGCGGGQHTGFVAPKALDVVAVDLNSIEVAKMRNLGAKNVEFIEADISEMDLGRDFDIVFSIGVIHHTDDPDRAVRNLMRHVRPGGRLILWVYSKEGNWLAEHIVEAGRRMFLKNCSTATLLRLAQTITMLMYAPIYTFYILPLRFMPYYEYFCNFRKLSYRRNSLNVFDKLNAPQVQFIDRSRALGWFETSEFKDLHLARYRGVSWQISATRVAT